MSFVCKNLYTWQIPRLAARHGGLLRSGRREKNHNQKIIIFIGIPLGSSGANYFKNGCRTTKSL